jgi:hypothetical protein
VTDAALRAAVARAGGALVALDVTGCRRIMPAALLAAVTANGSTLRELLCSSSRDDAVGANTAWTGFDELPPLLLAAPQLRVLDSDVQCSDEEGDEALQRAYSLLCSEPPFQPLRVRFLSMSAEDVLHINEADALALAAGVAAHPWLLGVQLLHIVFPNGAAVDALLDAALARRVTSLKLSFCDGITPANVPALARLIEGGALTELCFDPNGVQLFDDVAGAELFAHALRQCSTLTSLSLVDARLWHDLDVARALLAALTTHPRLRTLALYCNRCDDDMGFDAAHQAAVGALLGALVAADAPALHTLNVSRSAFGDAVMGPLFAALPRNTHLRSLDTVSHGISAAFARDVLLPAVRANTGLRMLRTRNGAADADTFTLEAEQLVKARADAEAVVPA